MHYGHLKNRIIRFARIFSLLAIFFLTLNAFLFAQGDRANLIGTMGFFGHELPYSFYVKPKSKWKELPEKVFQRNISEIERAGIPDSLREAFDECGLGDNDFAKLLFIVSFVKALDFDEDTIIRSLAQMVRYGKANQTSRILLAASICQTMGYAAIAVVDDKENYYLSVSFCKNERSDSMATNASFGYEGRVFYLVDLSLRYPVGLLPEEPGSSFKIIGEPGDAACISFFPDSVEIPDLPQDSTADKKISYFFNYKNVNYEICFHLKANLRDYVSNFPLALPLFFFFAKAEIAETGCVNGIMPYMEGLRTEVEKVNFLLGIVQDSALCVYCEGAIKPTTITLFEREADCDTRSQILAGLLLNTGFKHILVLTTKEHLTLALAPEDEETIIPGGKFILHEERKYYFLDPAIVNGKWGTETESEKWEIILNLEKMENLEY